MHSYILSLAILDPLVRLSNHKFIVKTAYAKNFIKCFPTCFYFLNLHIGVKEMSPKLILRQSYGNLKRSYLQWDWDLTELIIEVTCTMVGRADHLL